MTLPISVKGPSQEATRVPAPSRPDTSPPSKCYEKPSLEHSNSLSGSNTAHVLITCEIMALDVGGRNESLGPIYLPHSCPTIPLVLFQDLHFLVFRHWHRALIGCCNKTKSLKVHAETKQQKEQKLDCISINMLSFSFLTPDIIEHYS